MDRVPFILCILLGSVQIYLVSGIEPITTSLLVGGVGAGLSALGYNFDYIKGQTYCRFQECCTNDYISPNIKGLIKDLEENVFGQHIVAKILPRAIISHWSEDRSPDKPLVMTFHGTTGIGKNYVADIIARNLYKKGLSSKYVHIYLGRADFPLESEVSTYKIRLKDAIESNVKSCSKSLFIFDETDKMPEGIFESVTSLLDHHKQLNGIDYRQSIFIFLTNTGGYEISQQLNKLQNSGMLREESDLHHFESICQLIAFNLEGGLKSTSLIESSLIDHFIPFLPLEKRHVDECIKAEFNRRSYVPTDKQINDISTNYVSYKENFSVYGCKRIQKKVALEIPH